MARKIPKLERRLGKVVGFLEAQQGLGENDPHKLLADAYRWFFLSSRHDASAPIPEDWAEYHIGNPESFDAILTGQSVYEANEIRGTRQRHMSQEAQKRGQEVLGTPASRVSISPQFDAMYAQVPKQLQKQVADKLKKLALSTTNKWRFSELIALKNDMPCVEVAPGVKLVAELEAGTDVHFLGFIFQALQRPAVSERYGLPKVVAAGLAISILLLVTSLLYVPYDVVMSGNGPRVEVFMGYTPVWLNPDIHQVCGAYLEERLEPGFAFRNCYSSISLSRAAFGSSASMILVMSFLGVIRFMRSRKEI